jgi:RND family efflux transporter MFP subunit
MKNAVILIAMLVMVSCAPGDSGDPVSELKRYRQEAREINEKIAALESEMESMQLDNVEEEPLPVEIKELKPEAFTRYFEVKGYMEAVRDALISPEISGQIKEVVVDRGARVRKDDLLVKLNTDVTEKTIAEVRTGLELATRVFEKQEELWEQNIGSELQYLEAKNGKESLEARLATLEKQLAMAHIRAPFSGIVDEVLVKAGEISSPGMPMIRLVNLEEMRVSSRISESYLNSVSVGDQVQLRFPSYPDEILQEKVSRLGEVIDQQTRTIALEVLLRNKNEMFKPNMLTSVRIEEYSVADALVVPSIVLKQDFQGTFLFVARETSTGTVASKVYVTPGYTVQDQTMVNEGLTGGDKVITKGYNLVADGSPVRIVTI